MFGHMQKDCHFGNQQHIFHLQKHKILKETCSLLFKQQLKNIKMCGIWITVAATNHMMGDKDAFIDMNSSFCLKVKLGNGEYVEVEGKGSIGVATK